MEERKRPLIAAMLAALTVVGCKQAANESLTARLNEANDKVVDSRAIPNGEVIRRRRVCAQCGHRFTTYEQVVKAVLRVLKRDGRHEDFDRAKLRAAIAHAAVKRPISEPQLDVLVDDLAALDRLEFALPLVVGLELLLYRDQVVHLAV